MTHHKLIRSSQNSSQRDLISAGLPDEEEGASEPESSRHIFVTEERWHCKKSENSAEIAVLTPGTPRP